jgi:NAD(P)-dependent dehydrogenase (short-subunit alcohol dehydrogenase family)
MTKKLEGRVAIVTGGQRGLGAAIVREFVAEGATCFINYPNGSEEQQAASLVEELKSLGSKVIANQADVGDESQIAAFIRSVETRAGKIDILVNNAGVNSNRTWEDMTRQAWDLTLNVNLTGTYLCCKAVLEPMKGRKSGNIINIASVAPFLGRRNVDYISTKSALLGLTRSLARQYGSFGIRANAISPGFHDTDMLKRSFQVSGVNPEEFIKRTPLGYLPGPEGIGKAALFLASDDAAFITGHNLVVDGELTLR